MRKTTGPRFCFECGKQLRGRHKKILVHKIDQYPRTFHKTCAQHILKIQPCNFIDYETKPSVQQNAASNEGKYLPNGEEAK